MPRLEVTRLLKEAGIRPDKSLGQNFLVDENALRNIIAVSQLSSTDTVLEIGSGLGNLTRYLAMSAQEVVAVELSGALIPVLQKVVKGYGNVQVVEGDILKLSIDDLIKADQFLVVANIPYYITSAIIRHLLNGDHKPGRMILTIQKEVAQRICARPGEMSLLALSVQVYGKPDVVAQIPAEAFYPAPEVDSSVIRIAIFPEPLIPTSLMDSFFALARAGFSQKRKTLRNSLSGGLSTSPAEAEMLLKSAGIDPKRRAETLEIGEWTILTQCYQRDRR